MHNRIIASGVSHPRSRLKLAHEAELLAWRVVICGSKAVVNTRLWLMPFDKYLWLAPALFVIGLILGYVGKHIG